MLELVKNSSFTLRTKLLERVESLKRLDLD
nr:MAG TPA: hypothetical protein [Caudoviricetes sp.]